MRTNESLSSFPEPTVIQKPSVNGTYEKATRRQADSFPQNMRITNVTAIVAKGKLIVTNEKPVVTKRTARNSAKKRARKLQRFYLAFDGTP